MKKIVGVLGVAVIAATMFFSANGVTDSPADTNLASLLGMNSANAEWQDDGITVGSTDCTCSGSTCQDANWISFRKNCGNVSGTSTDGACAIAHAGGC
jgi:hypothetical protein